MIRNQFLLAILITLGASPAQALNTQLFHPIAGQHHRGLSVYGSQGLDGHQFKSGVFINLVDDPLEFSIPPDQRVDQIVDEFVTADLLFSYGFNDWLTVHFNAPVNLWSNVEPLSDYEASEDFSFGDLRFSATLHLFQSENSKSGIAMIPFFTVSMDNTDDFFSENSFTAGGLLALDHQLAKRHYIALNIGGHLRKKESVLNLVVAHQFLASISYVGRLSCQKSLDFFAELQSSTTFRKFFYEEISSPVELMLGLRKQSPSKRWETTIGFGRAANNGYGAPDFRVFGGLTYLFGKQPRQHCCELSASPEVVEPTPPPVAAPVQDPVPTPTVQPELIVRYVEPIYFKTGKDEIEAQSHPALDEVFQIISEFPDIETIRIEAHTDSDGTEEANLLLSGRRAKSAMMYLVEKGIHPSKIKTEGFGEKRPVASNDTGDGKAKNRRVEFIIESDSQHIKIIQKR